MIEQVIPCTMNFTRETILGRLEVEEMNLRLSGDLPRMETIFSALSVCPTFSRSISMSGDYAGSSRSRNEEDKKIEEGIALLVKREPDGKKIFKCWTCQEYGHFASKCPKRVKKYRNNFKPRRSKECSYANDEDLEDSIERTLSESDNDNFDDIGFVGFDDNFESDIKE